MAVAQADIYSEEFEFSFITKKTGGQVLYNGSNHYFTIDLISKNIKRTEYPNYISVDNHIVQTSLVPLPPSNMDLKKLTVAQQKEILEGYISYELEYFRTDLKLNYKNLKKEWVTLNSKLWLVWSFDVPSQEVSDNVSQKTISQIYTSTVCFNQVLDLNIPILQGDNFLKSRQLINKLMSTLKLSSK